MSLLVLCPFVDFAHAEQTNQLSRLTNVNSIVQDQQGYLWFASQQGLARYDGNKLLNFGNNSPNWQLPFTWTHNIKRVNSNLLVSTEDKRLWLFDSKANQSFPLNITTKSNTVYNAAFFAGQYFIFTKAPNMLYRFDPKTSQTHLLNENIKLNGFLSTEQALYFHNHDGVFQIGSQNIQPLIEAPIKAAIANEEWLVVATDKALISFHKGQQQFNTPIEEEILALTFEHGNNHFFSINSKNAINKYDQTLEKIVHGYSTNLTVQSHLIYHDSSGALWLAGPHGVKKITPVNIKNHERIYDTFINGIQIEVVEDNLIIGSYGAGLQELSKHQSVIAPTINTQLSKKALLITDLLTIDKTMYMATFDGLWRYQIEDKSLAKVSFKNNDKILLRLVAKDNLLYIATDANGFIVYDLETEKVIQEVDSNASFSSHEVIDILPLKQSIWLATARGIDIFDKESKEIETIALTSNKVMSLATANNKIYAATKGNGIFVFNFNKELLAHFAIGIDFEHIRHINGEIWAPSSNGLYRISIEDNQLTMVPGTESYSFSSEAILHNNTIYVGHYGGVLAVPLTPEHKLNAKVYISQTTLSGQSYLGNKTINIDNSNEVITLNLASLDYRKGQDKQFKYQINSGSWNKVSGSQFTLTGLSSGSYYLTIAGTNSLGQWSNFQAFTEIHVAFPWYWTPQIRVIYVILTTSIFLMILWLLYLRGKSINYIHKVLSTEAKSKSKTLLYVSRNLSHALSLSKNNKSASLADLEKTKEKIESILQESINELSNPSQSKVPDGLYGKSLQVAIPYFIQYLSNKYHVRTHLDYTLDETQLPEDLITDIYKIIYEALTSAILNGSGQNYRLSLKKTNEKIWITMNDDANSFSNFRSQINFDMAIYFIRQIANKYNATVNTFDQQSQGSQLVISIPLRTLG